MWEKVAQEVCGISILEGTQSSLGEGSEQTALVGHALSGGVSKCPPGVNYPTIPSSTCKVQLLEYVVYYMSQKSLVLLKALLWGKEGSAD